MTIYKYIIITIAMTLFAQSAQAEIRDDRFHIGLLFGPTKWSTSGIATAGTTDQLSFSENDTGNSTGIVGRYTINKPIGKSDNAIFTGFQFALNNETATPELKDFPYDNHLVTITFKPQWSADIMVRAGSKIGDASFYVASGLSLVHMEIDGVVTGKFVNISGSEEKTHTGWKIATGVDYHFSDKFTIFSQIEYAQYSQERYANEVSSNEPILNGTGLRIGIMYPF